MTLSDSGNVHGHDGCNSFGYIPWDCCEGPFWTQENNHIVFHGMIMSTMMACQGHDEALARADTFILDGDDLLLFKDGELLGTMIPA
ncbi:META domain-containing protein [Corynebacterium sp. A21]|uniref:META domain-containing protein n=1 Tax=Corynebacterium sp. A21 TaxID=3457318 RepID=UPI003FD1F957